MKRSLRAADFDFEGRIWPAGRSLPTPALKPNLQKNHENLFFLQISKSIT